MNGIHIVGPVVGRGRYVLERALCCTDALEEFNTGTPKAYVALGTAALQSLTSVRRIPITKSRGYRYEGPDGVPVISSLEPSFIGMGKMNLMPLLVWDISRALDERDSPAPQWPLEKLELYPSPSIFSAWLAEAAKGDFIAHDIETRYSRNYDEENDGQDPSYEITRFSLASSSGSAITAPYEGEFVEILKSWLASTEIDRVGWNSDEFDDPREAYNGWPLLGTRIDARWLWHFLQPSLPQSLACVSTFFTRVPEWKSIGSAKGTEDELYSAMDAWATAQCYLGITKDLKGRRIQ